MEIDIHHIDTSTTTDRMVTTTGLVTTTHVITERQDTGTTTTVTGVAPSKSALSRFGGNSQPLTT
jgi:hypothetical protein